MQKIKFTADSTCDLSEDLIKELNVDILPLSVTLGDKTYHDGVDIFPSTIYDYVEKNDLLPKTAAPSPEDYINLFSKYSEGYDAVIHFNISSNLSASNQNAKIASQKFSNVHVIDSLSLSTGTSLLLLKADRLFKEGKSAKEITEIINSFRDKVMASFVVNTLEYLHKGGRCSGIERLGATILKLHPVLLLKEGNITVYKKLRGKIKDVYIDYIDILHKNFPEPEKEFAFLTHSGCSEEYVEQVKARIQELYNFKNIYVTVAGSTITSHCGKGTLGLLFINKTKI